MKHDYLIGEKVILRTMIPADLEYAIVWANDPAVTKYMYLGTFPACAAALRREYNEMIAALPGNLTQESKYPTRVMFTMRKKRAHEWSDLSDLIGAPIDLNVFGTPIGWLGLFDINWITRVAEFRAIIGEKSCWGKGYAFDAYRLALGYGFDRLNLRKITGGQRVDNYAAIKTARKVGFVQEGCLREHFLRNGQAYDIIVNGVLREEFYALFPSMEGGSDV